jgi:hypothetical protein
LQLAPSPEGEGWGEGDLSAIKATLIPTLLPWEKGFNLVVLKVILKSIYIINPSIGKALEP